MLILENVRKIGNIISANYRYPPETDCGYVEYDINKGKYTKIIYCETDRDSEGIYGFPKIERIIKNMIKYDKYPETYKYYWY